MSETYLVYHYCTVETFKSILKSKVLWLCDLTDSNDEQEVIRTFVVLWEGVKKRLKQTDIPKDVLDNAIQLIDQQKSKLDHRMECVFARKKIYPLNGLSMEITQEGCH